AISDAALSGDVITFDNGVTGTITLSSSLSLDSKALTIQGPGASLLTIDGNNVGSVFALTAPPVGSASPTTISGLTIQHGASDRGGGIFAGSNTILTVEDSVITNNAANGSGIGAGGGIAADSGAMLTIINSTI